MYSSDLQLYITSLSVSISLSSSAWGGENVVVVSTAHYWCGTFLGIQSLLNFNGDRRTCLDKDNIRTTFKVCADVSYEILMLVRILLQMDLNFWRASGGGGGALFIELGGDWDEHFGMNLSCRAGRLIFPGNKYIRPAAEAGADYIN